MKIKVCPDDFVVEELTSIPVQGKGPYTLVKLTKQYWNTLDAIDYIARQLKIPRSHIARAGLKDRYSRSTQYLTIQGHVQGPFRTDNLTMMPIGKTQRAMSPHFLLGNRFTITLRDCCAHEIRCIEQNAPHVAHYGLVNYFDEQRFGSARHKKGFFAKELLLNHFQGALKLLLCHPYKEDGKQERRFKRYCHEHWGDWRGCYNYAHAKYRRIITRLIEKPRGYKDAIKAIDRELLNLYLLAYQSYLFNEIAREYITAMNTDLVVIPYNVGRFAFFKSAPPAAFTHPVLLPMLNEKTTLSKDIAVIIRSILDREGIRLRDFGLRKMRFRGVRFKPFQRPLMFKPRAFAISTLEDDNLYPHRKKITIRFEMPPGSYATLVIKRLLACQEKQA